MPFKEKKSIDVTIRDIFIIMKFAAAILAFIILITSIYPVSKQSLQFNSSLSKQHGECCLKKNKGCPKIENSNQTNNSKKNCNSGCSPFMTCNYFPVTEPLYFLLITPKVTITNTKFPLGDEYIISNYYAEIWHPPQAYTAKFI